MKNSSPLKTCILILFTQLASFYDLGLNLYSKSWLKSQLLLKYFHTCLPISKICILISYSIVKFSNACLIFLHLDSYLLEGGDQAFWYSPQDMIGWFGFGFWLGYDCSAVLCWCLPHSGVNELWHRSSPFGAPPPSAVPGHHTAPQVVTEPAGRHRAPGWAPCAGPQAPTRCLFHAWSCRYVAAALSMQFLTLHSLLRLVFFKETSPTT